MPPEANLTRRASLGAFANAVRIGTQLVIGLAVTPVIALGLGRELYGVWAIVQQLTAYIALLDLRATSTVKFTLAATAFDADIPYKRQQIGACLFVLRRVAVGVLLIGAGMTWLAPAVIDVPASDVASLRWALGLGVVGLIVGEYSSVPGNVLRGLNLEHRTVGLTAAAAALSALLSVAAIKLGLGIIGLGIAVLTADVALGFGRLVLVRRLAPWFGADAPGAVTLGEFWRRTRWVSVASLAFLLQTALEVLVAGILFGPTAAAIFGATAAVVRMSTGATYSLIAAAAPGLAGLAGRRDWRRLESARNDLHLMACLLITACAVPVLLFNGEFVAAWLRADFYGGRTLDMLLVAGVVLSIPLRLDAMVLDGLLALRRRALIALLCGASGLFAAVMLGRSYGLAGVAAGVAAGSAVCSMAYVHAVSRYLPFRDYVRWMWRPAAIASLMLAAAAAAPVSMDLELPGTLAAMAAAGLVALLGMLAGVSRSHRAALWARVRGVL